MTENENELLPQKVESAINSIKTLNNVIESCGETEVNFRHSQNQANADKLLRFTNTIAKQYQESFRLVDDLIGSINSLIKKSNATNDSNTTSLPSATSIRDLLKIFFLEKVKTHPSPFPSNSGCWAFKKKIPKENSFICGKRNGFFYLMIAVSFENKIVTAIDTSDLDDPVTPITLPLVDWTPMPSIIPEKPIARWEHAKDSFVLSLYKRSPTVNDSWTTQFFRAQILSRPCDTIDDPERGYLLDFGNGITQKVAEQFVANLPKEWEEVSRASMLQNFL